MALEKMNLAQAYNALINAGYEITGYDPERGCFDASHKKKQNLTVWFDSLLNVFKVQRSW